MRELVKQIRQYTGLSQTEMAKKIGVQFATINRWENGHSQPTRLAGEGLFALCEDFNVPVYDMIIEKVKREVSSLKIVEPSSNIVTFPLFETLNKSQSCFKA